jgi:copper homeostasis protein
LGVLTRSGTVDLPVTRHLVEIARPMQVTFHRAFDVTRDLDAALEDVVAAGADIVLTSGGAKRITEAVDVVMRLVERAGTRVEIMGGSGVRVQNAAALCEATGLSALHASLRRPLQQEDTTMVHVLPDALPTYELREEDVRALAAVLESCAGTPSSRSQFE